MSSRALDAPPPGVTEDASAELPLPSQEVAVRHEPRVVLDRKWLEDAYGAHAGDVKLRVTAIVADPALADDLTQETFVAAWRGRRHFAGNCPGAGSPTRAWLLGIATNVARNARRSRTRAWLRRALGRGPRSSDIDEQTPESSLVAEQAAQALFAAMTDLPPEQSEAFGLRVIEGLSLEQCAEVLALPMSTVSYRARKAEEKLRRALEKDDR